MVQRVAVVSVSCCSCCSVLKLLQCCVESYSALQGLKLMFFWKKNMNTHCWVSVAVCGSVLQCVAVCCSVLRCVAEFCNVLDLMFFARRLCIYATDVLQMCYRCMHITHRCMHITHVPWGDRCMHITHVPWGEGRSLLLIDEMVRCNVIPGDDVCHQKYASRTVYARHKLYTSWNHSNQLTRCFALSPDDVCHGN